MATRSFNLAADCQQLDDLARRLGDVALIVVDPITAYLGRTDSHKNAEVRAVLAPLAAMASEIGAAIVCVSHLTKAGGTEAMLRVMGSLGFVAAARGAYLVAKDPEDDTRRLFLKKAARRDGITDKVLRRAREKLGIKPRKRSFEGGWWWELGHAQDAQDAYTLMWAPCREKGILGHLPTPNPISKRVPYDPRRAPKRGPSRWVEPMGRR